MNLKQKNSHFLIWLFFVGVYVIEVVTLPVMLQASELCKVNETEFINRIPSIDFIFLLPLV
ncbi:MAG TPA: hypothetical protein K8V56_05475 [Sporosarcina psychrophila]|uniref:Uncharacterized protein n=1 Tax=Sporosarcina psychrophila TaxID=1476 RepID=A0A921KDS3_SPOPS|nr:hypothetical protein [Sporosarcina psychrophila]